MIVETAIFTCSICGERSTDICVGCTKDTCTNHRCDRCKRCSDCCECEMPLSAVQPEPDPVPETELAAAEIPVSVFVPELEGEQLATPAIPALEPVPEPHEEHYKPEQPVHAVEPPPD